MKQQAPKGTFDILPYGVKEPWQLSYYWNLVEQTLRQISDEYGYREIRTPIYEMSALFQRGVGESSDIVTKEMFTFEDKGGRSITLRPEGTSCVMRSFIEHGLQNVKSAHKLFYTGPMFRYERPQSGRYRQHHQFGVEAIGNAGAEQDAEVIDLLFSFYRRLGIQNITVHINSVGDVESRAAYKKALCDFLRPSLLELSSDSQVRFEKNPLRILDSKDPKDKEILQKAPSILDFLSKDAKKHFETVIDLLEKISIPYKINEKIVRGLDYYNKTVFEVLTDDLGAQNTIGAGGRFDGLISSLGGAQIPAVGFATGLERVIQVLIAQKKAAVEDRGPLVYFIPIGEEAISTSFALLTACRHANIAAEMEMHTKKMQSAMQNALKAKATFCVLIGTEELANKTLQIKNLETREQKELSQEALIRFLQEHQNG